MLKTLSQIAPCLADFFVLGQIQPNSGERRRLAQALWQDLLKENKNIEGYHYMYIYDCI